MPHFDCAQLMFSAHITSSVSNTDNHNVDKTYESSHLQIVSLSHTLLQKNAHTQIHISTLQYATTPWQPDIYFYFLNDTHSTED